MLESAMPLAGKYVCFMAGGGRYGIPIEQVVRIIRQEEIIDVPHAPRYVQGVINLRGEVIPIINVRERFGLPREEASRRRRIIVAHNRGKHFGLLVDEVRDIVEVKETMIDRDTASTFIVGTDLVPGIAKIGEGLVILLDVARVISSSEVAAARS